jgi:FtsP/CotA-like multicopper oxidase with cupredoxin domain
MGVLYLMKKDSGIGKKIGAGVALATILLGALIGVLGTANETTAAPTAPPGTIDPTVIPKWVNEITSAPPVFVPTEVKDLEGNVIRHDYTVDMTSFDQQILPAGFPKTHVWGYGGDAKDALTGESLGYVHNSPAPSFEATRGIPIQVTWQNKISEPYMFCVDPTLHWADPNDMGMLMGPAQFDPCPPGYEQAQSPAPLVTHVHGLEVDSRYDGGPTAWFTYDGIHGPTYSTLPGAAANEAIYRYENEQPASTLWYHDHGLGVTRINVMSGLAGFYFLRDPTDLVAPQLPSGKYEVPLALQDRIFNTDGTFWFPNVGINTDMHPYWQPEFFGNTMMVDGLVWPKMNVDQGWYRFRVLDGSNARFYTLSFKPQDGGLTGPLPFYVIGTEGGYLQAPARMTSLTIAPGERADVLIDFSSVPAGTKVLMSNIAKAPYPAGTPADPRTVGQVMQFVVNGVQGYSNGQDLIGQLPTPLNPYLPGTAFPTLPAPTNTRTMTLWEVMGMNGPLMVTLNGQSWTAPVSETPKVGTTEDWVIVDLTGDTHPIHLHLATFQVVSRQKIDVAKYTADWLAMNSAKCGVPTPPWPDDCHPDSLAVGPYLRGKPSAALPNERGWKDTVKMSPGEVTIIRVRFAPIDGTETYPFDATFGPGYVWHCHIIDHEDNEMMRPYVVAKPA